MDETLAAAEVTDRTLNIDCTNVNTFLHFMNIFFQVVNNFGTDFGSKSLFNLPFTWSISLQRDAGVLWSRPGSDVLSQRPKM